MMKLAQHIIRTKSGEFDSSMLEDHYRSACSHPAQKAGAGFRARARCQTIQENVVNLMDALRRSISAEHPTKLAPKRGSVKGSPRGPTRARRAG
jgi:non-homologous end joining protein Ku